MKKTLQWLLLLCILISCEKQVDQVPSDNGTSGNKANITLRETYLPLTKGTYWKYNVASGSVKDPSIVRVLGLQKIIRGKTYEKVQVVKDSERDTIFYNQTNDKYYMYTNSSGSGETVDLELLFLYDDQPVNFEWQGTAGSTDGLPARYTGQILQRDISLTVNGTTYRHVIHTRVQVQVRILFYVTASIEDFYVAEGIGIITNISSVKLGDPSVTVSNITDYRVN